MIGVLFQGSVFSNNVVNYDVNSLKSHELIFEKIEKIGKIEKIEKTIPRSWPLGSPGSNSSSWGSPGSSSSSWGCPGSNSSSWGCPGSISSSWGSPGSNSSSWGPPSSNSSSWAAQVAILLRGALQVLLKSSYSWQFTLVCNPGTSRQISATSAPTAPLSHAGHNRVQQTFRAAQQNRG